jgi:hypothetical protein
MQLSLGYWDWFRILKVAESMNFVRPAASWL